MLCYLSVTAVAVLVAVIARAPFNALTVLLVAAMIAFLCLYVHETRKKTRAIRRHSDPAH